MQPLVISHLETVAKESANGVNAKNMDLVSAHLVIGLRGLKAKSPQTRGLGQVP